MVNQAQKNDDLWFNEFPYGKIPIFVGRKKKYESETVASLELLGKATTTEISHFVLSQAKSERERANLAKYEVLNRGKIFNKLITGRLDRKRGRRKLGKYPGLADHGFIKKIDVKKTKKNIDTNVWFPTLKSHIVALGYNFDDDELKKFLNTASNNSLFFAYIKNLSDIISLDFVKMIFLQPILELIKNGILDLNNDLRYVVWMIPFQIGLEIEKTINDANKIIYHSNLAKKYKNAASIILKSIEKMMNNTWYDSTSIKWKEKMIDLYYQKESEKAFYVFHAHSYDSNFLYNVMQHVHQSYYATFGEKTPSKHEQKFPIPIRREKKFAKSEEYDIPSGTFMTALEREKYKKS